MREGKRMKGEPRETGVYNRTYSGRVSGYGSLNLGIVLRIPLKIAIANSKFRTYFHHQKPESARQSSVRSTAAVHVPTQGLFTLSSGMLSLCYTMCDPSLLVAQSLSFHTCHLRIG